MTHRAPPLLEVRELSKTFTVRGGLLRRAVGHVRAVEGVTLTVSEGESLGLVGESGCGKTTTARAILRLTEPDAGRVVFHSRLLAPDGARRAPVDVTGTDPETLRTLRREMQIIYQDPFSSLDPRMTVSQILEEPFEVQGLLSREERRERASRLLRAVGLDPDHLGRYPHEFSGGQRQRIGIARALALDPGLVVADEAVSALDVSVQAQILNLLADLQDRLGLAYLFIAHDLSVVRHVSDRVAVMYLGRLVESAETTALFTRPRHPYTEALMSAVPIPDPDHRRERILLPGDVPNAMAPPPGCPFHPRCRFAEDVCRVETPDYRDLGSGHRVACHLAESLVLQSPWRS